MKTKFYSIVAWLLLTASAFALVQEKMICLAVNSNSSKPLMSSALGGMRKRVAVARALVGSPEYIFYDEPTTGLDPVTSEQIDDMIYELAQKMNVTSIVITHDMFSVFRIADEVAMLDKGKVLFEGSAEELKATNDPIVKEFISRFMIS